MVFYEFSKIILNNRFKKNNKENRKNTFASLCFFIMKNSKNTKNAFSKIKEIF